MVKGDVIPKNDSISMITVEFEHGHSIGVDDWLLDQMWLPKPFSVTLMTKWLNVLGMTS